MRVIYFEQGSSTLVLGICVCLAIACNLSLANSRIEDVSLPTEDRIELVKDILARQQRMEDSVFSRTWQVSSQNIEYMHDPLLANSAFHLISPVEIEQQANHYVVEYQVFKKFSVRDVQAEVTVRRVAEGETCFSGYMQSEEVTTYVYRRQAGKWVPERTRRSMPQQAVFRVKKKAFL